MLSQHKYSLDLIIHFNMDDCKESNFPFLFVIKLGEFGDSPLVDYTLYMQLVGSLLYLTNTRPDLYFDVSVVERYMQKTHEIHWKASKNILQYVQETKSFEVHYAASSSLELVGFFDSYCAIDINERNSTSSFFLFFPMVLFSVLVRNNIQIIFLQQRPNIGEK